MTGSLDWMVVDRPLNTVSFESLSHTNTILHGLNELRSQEYLLDITLLADGKSFKAHRVVLASCSDYFRAMFTDAMRESRQSEICLNGVTALGIELLLNYAYTSKLDLNLANVQDVLSAASHVQMDAVVVACTDYLQTQLDTENCVDLLTISETYSLQKLRQKCYRFICGHLYEFSVTNEINRLAWHQLEHILSCDFPVDCSEQVVLRIVLQWIESQAADIKITHRLLHHVRLSDINTVDLEHILAEAQFPVDSHVYSSTLSLAAAQRRLRRQIKSTSSFPTASSNNHNALTNLRGMELALVNVGGFRVAGITNEITYYLPSTRKWQHITSIPHVEQCNYGTAVLGNELYVVGGCYNVCLNEYIHPFGFRFNPMANKWTTLAPMQSDRCRFSLNFVGGILYAVGGVSEVDGDESGDELELDGEGGANGWGGRAAGRPDGISNSERYDPVTDRWEYIESIPENRTQHAGAGCDGHLYISGGLERQRVLASLWRYNTSIGGWEQLPDMPSPRADHVMLVVNDRLFVCGGWCEADEHQADNRRLVDTIDVYDPVERSWSVMTTIPTPKYHAGIVAVETRVYVVGGFYSDSMFDRASSTIECYDIARNEWSVLDRYPQNIWECSCVALYIPKFRDDMEVMIDEATANTDIVLAYDRDG